MVRSLWVWATAREFQVLAGQFLDLSPETRPLALEAALARVLPPKGPIEGQLLNGWIPRAEDECRVRRPARADTVAERVRAHVEAHLDGRLTVQSIAKALQERPRAIASAFRQLYGITVHQYVDERRFKAVEVLLVEGVKVEAAARLVGFGSRKGLYRLVHAKTGLTPRALAGTPGRVGKIRHTIQV